MRAILLREKGAEKVKNRSTDVQLVSGRAGV